MADDYSRGELVPNQDDLWRRVANVEQAGAGGAGSDTTAIHVDTPNEISGITLKGSAAAGDLLVIEDSADGFNKKSLTAGSLIGSPVLPTYSNVYWADPAGDAAEAGDNPAKPTTLANALSTATAGALIVLAPGTYSDGDGPASGTTTFSTANLTLQAAQATFTDGATTILSDAIVFNASSGSPKIVGLQLTGNISDTSCPGDILLQGCYNGGGATSITRTTPAANFEITDGDFDGTSYTSTGGTGQSLFIYGSKSRIGDISLGQANDSLLTVNVERIGSISHTGGAGTLATYGPTLIQAPAPGDTISAVNVVWRTSGPRVETNLGAPGTVTVGVNFISDTVLDYTGSTLGAALTIDTWFTRIGFAPATPADWAVPPTLVSEGLNSLAADRVVGPGSAVDNAVTRFDTTSGKLIQDGAVLLDDDGNFTGIESAQLNIAPTSQNTTEGSMYWDAVDKCLVVKNDVSDASLQVGQENWIRVFNNSGALIPNGSVVYVSGSQGGSGEGRLTIDLALADTATTSRVIGAATHDIANNSYGYVTQFGLVRDVDTSGATAGDSAWLSATVPGGWTIVEPESPNISVFLGYVAVADAVNGVGFITTLGNTGGAVAGAATLLTLDARKGSPGTINAGQPVYISGYNVGQGVIEVELADASVAAEMPALGLAGGTITNSITGVVVTNGLVSNINTAAFSVGDPVYVATTPGVLTNVRPTGATTLIQKVGTVTRSNASNGIIEVSGAGRANDLPQIAQDNFWIGDATGTAQENTATQARIVLNVADGSESNAAANVGTGVGAFDAKVGSTLNMRSVTGTDDVGVSLVSQDIQVSGSALLPLDGGRTMTGNLNMGANYVQVSDIAAPVNPLDGQGRLYKKTGDDGLFWLPDSAGPEVDLTSGGGSGPLVSGAVSGFTNTTNYYEAASSGTCPGVSAGTWCAAAMVRIGTNPTATESFWGTYQNFGGGGWMLGINASRFQFQGTDITDGTFTNFGGGDFSGFGISNRTAILHVVGNATDVRVYVMGYLFYTRAWTGGLLVNPTTSATVGVVAQQKTDATTSSVIGVAYGTHEMSQDDVNAHVKMCMTGGTIVDDSTPFETIYDFSGEAAGAAPASITNTGTGAVALNLTGALTVARENPYGYVSGS